MCGKALPFRQCSLKKNEGATPPKISALNRATEQGGVASQIKIGFPTVRRSLTAHQTAEPKKESPTLRARFSEIGK